MSQLVAAAPFDGKGLLRLQVGRQYKIVDLSGVDALASAVANEPLPHD